MQKSIEKYAPTARFGLIQGFYWAAAAPIMSFASTYLTSKGFTNSQIGYVIAIGCTLASVLQPVVGALADRSKKMILRQIIMLLSLAVILTTGGLFGCGHTFWLIALLYGLMITLHQLITPFVYSIGMFFMNRGVRINYGLTRAVGSITYAAAAAILGTLAARDVNFCLWSVLMLYALLTVSTLVFRFPGVSEENAASGAASEKRSMTQFIREHRRFAVLLIGSTLSFLSYNIINDYLVQIMEHLGYGAAEMGLANALAAIMELPALFLLTLIIRKFASGLLLKVSYVFLFFKPFLLFLATSLAGAYAAMCTQVLGYGLFAGASIYYVNQTIDPENAVLGQSLMNMTVTLGTVLGSLLGGWLLDLSGVPAMLAGASICAVAGAVIVCASAEKGTKQGEEKIS